MRRVLQAGILLVERENDTALDSERCTLYRQAVRVCVCYCTCKEMSQRTCMSDRLRVHGDCGVLDVRIQ